MFKKLIFFSFLFFFLFNNCRKDHDFILPPPVDDIDHALPPTYNGPLKVVWQQPLRPDTVLNPSFTPILFNGNVLFSNRTGSTNPEEGERLIMFNGQTGNRVWEWEDYIGRGSAAHSVSKSVINDKLLYNSENETYSIDLIAGVTDWTFEMTDGCSGNRITAYGLHLYTQHEPCAIENEASYLVRSPIDRPEWDTIYTHLKTDEKVPSLCPPGFWINPKGDTVLFFQNRSFSPWGGQIDLIAYNVSRDKKLYELTDIATGGNSNIRPPLIWEDKAYFAGTWEIFCIDLPTGEIKWIFDQGQFMTSNLVIAEDKLIVNPDARELYALNAISGGVIWHNTDSGSNCSDMVYHDGIVYFMSFARGLLYAVDIETGEHIWAEKTPNEQLGFPAAAFGKSGVAIDPERGYLYAMDDFFAMCIELPEK